MGVQHAMCDTTTLVPIPDFLWPYIDNFDESHPEYGIDDQSRRCLALDTCIVPAILALWEKHIPTLSCCCLHGQGFGTITLPRVIGDGSVVDPDDLIPAWKWKERAKSAECTVGRLLKIFDVQSSVMKSLNVMARKMLLDPDLR